MQTNLEKLVNRAIKLNVKSRTCDYLLEMTEHSSSGTSTKNVAASRLITSTRLLTYALERVVAGSFKTFSARDIAATTAKLLNTLDVPKGKASQPTCTKLKKALNQLFNFLRDHLNKGTGLFGSNLLNKQVFKLIGTMLFDDLSDKKQSVLSWIYTLDELNELKEILPNNVQAMLNTAATVDEDEKDNALRLSSMASFAATAIVAELSSDDPQIMAPFTVTTVDIVPNGNVAKTRAYPFHNLNATATQDSIELVLDTMNDADAVHIFHPSNDHGVCVPYEIIKHWDLILLGNNDASSSKSTTSTKPTLPTAQFSFVFDVDHTLFQSKDAIDMAYVNQDDDSQWESQDVLKFTFTCNAVKDIQLLRNQLMDIFDGRNKLTNKC